METAKLTTVLVDGSPYDGALQHQIGGSQVGRSGQEGQHGGGERVRRIGHYSERPPWSDEVLEIALDHGGVAVMHLLPKPVGPPGVQFDCDDPSASFEERHSQGANAGAQVDDKLAGPNGCTDTIRSAQS